MEHTSTYATYDDYDFHMLVYFLEALQRIKFIKTFEFERTSLDSHHQHVAHFTITSWNIPQ